MTTLRDKFSNELSDAQTERLAFLLEELGEAQQAIGKILRHGYDSQSPIVGGDTYNRDDLIKELGDVSCAIGMLADAGDIDRSTLLARAIAKKESVKQWMHHQRTGHPIPIEELR